ncbi:hypothetical protein GCM10009865_53040 [Aeromicrobium ponti]|uniref:S-layer family protein n=1 Tax=Cytobacillus oceanisediminis TaxID=665099 RepID=A0A562J5Y2_9BACI|nr:S-layer homology domain-containing protein [Cytobacillus oceanisediminis]TWH78334.1 S-layer family protein [Cytobacillus oceanisediminis]
MAYQPKSYRKFVATAATATLVASAVAPAAAAGFSDVSDRYQEAVSYLVENGIANGVSETQFGVSQTIKRGDAAVMLAKALGLDGATAPDAGFSDVPSRAKGAVNALKAAGYLNGKTATSFGFEAELTRGELAIILTNAYELKGEGSLAFTDVSDRYADAVKALVTNKITSGKTATSFGTSDAVKRGDFAIFLHKADTLEVDPATPEVVGVSAIDGKTVQLTFSAAVDADTLVDADGNDVITVISGTDALAPGAITQELSADGKTLTLKAASYFKGDYTVKVPFEIVKGANGGFLKAVNYKLNVNDKAAPVLSSAKSTIKSTADGIKVVTLTFNEDVASIDNVKIAGLNYTPNVVGNTATVAVDLDATKTYDITVVNAQDAAGNVKDVQVAPLNVSVDNTPASITSVVAAGENKVKVTLDKALKDDTLAITGKVGTFVTNIVTDATVNPKNAKEYTVTLNSSYLFKNGNTDTVTLTVAKEALVDTLGNVNTAEITKTVSVSKDVTAPGVSSVETTKANGKVTGFVVTYNEEVANLDNTKVAIVNSKGEILANGSVIATQEVSATDAKKVVYTLVDGLKADKYSFDLGLGYVTDKSLASNKSAKYSFTVDVADVTAPVETSFTIAGATVLNNVVTVDYDVKVKATGTGSALNPAAYQLNGVTLPADTKIEFVKDPVTLVVDQTQVVITLPEGFVKASDNKAIFRVTGVQTLDNKVSNAFIKELAVVDNTAPEAKSFVATNLNELTVTYSEALGALAVDGNVTDEIKLFDSKGASVGITSAAVTEGKLVLTVADAAAVTKLTTVEVDAAAADIVDAIGIVQKAGVSVNK